MQGMLPECSRTCVELTCVAAVIMAFAEEFYVRVICVAAGSTKRVSSRPVK